MKNGLYSVKFEAQGMTGGGVIVLQDGQLRGGDSGSYYRGTYSAGDDEFTAQVSVRTHFRDPGMTFIFGDAGGEISLSGTSQETSARATGSSPNLPGVVFNCQIEMVAD